MPGVKGRSGRKSLSTNRQNTQMILAETSPKAAGYLREVSSGITKGDPIRVDVCKYIINQDLGMPKAKTELTGKDGTPLHFIIGKSYEPPLLTDGSEGSE